MASEPEHTPPHPSVPEPAARDVGQDVLGLRVAAALIDLAVLFVIAVLVSVAAGLAAAQSGAVSVELGGVSLAVFLGLAFVYHVACEAATGRTVGKLLLGLRVVGRDGDRPSVTATAVRTALRVVDWLPFLYFAGFVTMLVTGERRQRLGDLAAGTSLERAEPIRRRGLVATLLGSFLLLATVGSVVAGVVMGGLLTGATSSSQSCIGERCNATARGDQTLELAGHQVAVTEIGGDGATFTTGGATVRLRSGETRQIGQSLIHLTSVEDDVATFSIDVSGLFAARADEPEEVAAYESYTQVTDDVGAITLELPTAWNDLDGAENPQVGPSMHAAPDLEAFHATWHVPGVIVELSQDGGSADIDALMRQLGPSGQCTSEGREPYGDPQLSGTIERWSNCGGADVHAVTAALATDDDRAVVRLFGQAVDDRDIAAIDQALATLEIGRIPLVSDDEWLAEVERVRQEIDRDFYGLGPELSAPVMREMAQVLRTCSRELESIGAPSSELDEVHALVRKACRQFDKGAKCLRTAARIGIPFGGSDEDRRQSRAIDCGFNSANRGSMLLFEADAEVQGLEIEDPPE